MGDGLEGLSFYSAVQGYTEDFGWVDPEGCHWDGPVDYIQGYVLGLCCCGDKYASLNYVLNGLEHIAEDSPHSFDAFSLWYREWVGRGEAIFGGHAARYFFFYWADSVGLTEHGTAVPGWLTQKGRTLLGDLRILREVGLLLSPIT